MINELLTIKNISFQYHKDRIILDNVSASLHSGELVCLLGPNGAGKSTLLKCLMSLLHPNQGSIMINNKDITEMTYRERASMIAFVPQHSNVIFEHSVQEYVSMGLANRYHMWQKPSVDDLKIVEQCLKKMELSGLANSPFRSLSGGEQQKAMISRALVQKPKLILFDEPTSALDLGNQTKVLQLVKDLSRDGYSIIMTTHDPDHPFALESNVWMLTKQGQLETGSLRDIMTPEKVSALYETEVEIVSLPEKNKTICITK